MRVAMVRDVKVVGSPAQRSELAGKLREAAQRARDTARLPPAQTGSEPIANQICLDTWQLREVRRELLGDQVHTRPPFLEKIRNDGDLGHGASEQSKLARLTAHSKGLTHQISPSEGSAQARNERRRARNRRFLHPPMRLTQRLRTSVSLGSYVGGHSLADTCEGSATLG